MTRLVVALLGLLALALSPPPPQLTGHRRILYVLDRVTFGPRPGDVERVQAMGLDRFIAQQLKPGSIDDSPCRAAISSYTTLGMTSWQLEQAYPNPKPPKKILFFRFGHKERPAQVPLDELSAAKLVRAVACEAQLQEVMDDFWFNHFNVFAQKGPEKWLLTSYERDVIRPRALGKFRDLLGAVAHSPAMLHYLDNAQSTVDERYAPAGEREDIEEMEGRMAMNKPGGRAKLGLNENYARELMELHTLGVDGGYTQRDVTELARVFTGWGMDKPNPKNPKNKATDYVFAFHRRYHDPGTKVVLGQTFPWTGEDEGEKALDMLASHPSTAHFIALELCRRFVADEPPQELVRRVAAAFTASDGDIRETLRALFADPGFYDPKNASAKVKSPFEFMVSALRATQAVLNEPIKIERELKGMGEPLYLCETPNGYPERGASWINSGALLARMNFALKLFNHNPNAPASADAQAPLQGVDRGNGIAVVQAYIAAYLGGQISERTRSALFERLDDPAISSKSENGKRRYQDAKLAALILGSPDFQRR